MNKHEARYAAAMQRITPEKIKSAVVRWRPDQHGIQVMHVLTDLNEVKHILGIRLSDTRHDAAINKVLSS